MNKRSDGRRRKSKRRSKRSKRCKSLLGKKIGINIHEGIYANKAQAIAVAYSQVRKRHPSCRRILGKKRRSKRRSMDGVRGSGENNYLSAEEQNVFKKLFTLNANGIYESKLFQTFIFNDTLMDTGIIELNNVNVSKTSDNFFIDKEDKNQNIVDQDYVVYLDNIIEYEY